MNRGTGLHGPASRSDRAQLVVVAAAAIALALVPMTVAYLQLGYAGDVATEPTGTAPGADAERALDRAVHDAAAEVAGEYRWENRGAAADAFRAALAGDLRDIEAARLDSGAAAEVTYAADLAAATTEGSPPDDATGVCPSGPNRAFGPCEADDGVLVQDRAAEATVAGAAFRLRIVRPGETTTLTVLVEVAG